MKLNPFLCFSRRRKGTARHRPSRTAAFVFETLEERVLFSADLSAVVQAVQTPQPLTPNTPVQATVQIQNNGTTNPVGMVSGQFGRVPGQQANQDLSLQDSTGNIVAFHLDGAGVGTVTMQNGHWNIQMSGTDGTSTLTVISQNGSLLLTGGIQIAGAMKGINGAMMDLQGALSVSGPVNSLTLGAVHGGSITASQIRLLSILGDLNQGTVSLGFGGPGDSTLWSLGAFYVGGVDARQHRRRRLSTR